MKDGPMTKDAHRWGPADRRAVRRSRGRDVRDRRRRPDANDHTARQIVAYYSDRDGALIAERRPGVDRLRAPRVLLCLPEQRPRGRPAAQGRIRRRRDPGRRPGHRPDDLGRARPLGRPHRPRGRPGPQLALQQRLHPVRLGRDADPSWPPDWRSSGRTTCRTGWDGWASRSRSPPPRPWRDHLPRRGHLDFARQRAVVGARAWAPASSRPMSSRWAGPHRFPTATAGARIENSLIQRVVRLSRSTTSRSWHACSQRLHTSAHTRQCS